MLAIRNGFRVATLLAVVAMGSGCSWFHHFRHDKAEPVEEVTPTVGPSAAAELGVKTPLPPDAEALKAATTLATDFYEMRLKLGKSGLPDAGEMKAYRAFLCPSLADAMDSARERQKAYIAAHPEDKPPLVEGDLFSSLFEGPDAVSAAGTEVEGDGARVTMAMHYGEGDDATRWKDDVLLSRNDGIWCISDVEYKGSWDFANKGKLSATLAEPFE